MAKRIRVQMNHGGSRQILRSTAVREDLKARLDKIAADAGPGFEAQVIRGRNRALGSVSALTPEAMQAEAEDRALTRTFGGTTKMIYTTASGKQIYATEKQVARWTGNAS